jgi:hypothetical protein
MSASVMSQTQQSAGTVQALSEGRAVRLPAQPAPRWLQVAEGRLWLTHSARSLQELPLDCWLQAGESVELPAGQDAVLEAWPTAHFVLLETAPEQAPVSASVALKPSAALRRWLQGGQGASRTPSSPSSSPRSSATPCAS